MKAIIKINNASYYSKFNFLTFDIEEMGSSFVAIKGLNPEFPNNKTDFSFDEIFIVDIETQMKVLKNQIEYMENLNENQAPKELKNKYLNDFQCLKKYCDFRKIKIEN